jgi:two-component system copper resistance phosphate regulon response regulator CusR
LLLDNLLPNGTGIDVCRQVRQINERLPIIFLSGSTLEDEGVIAMRSGANVFLTKPIILDTLYTTLANYVPLPTE